MEGGFTGGDSAPSQRPILSEFFSDYFRRCEALGIAADGRVQQRILHAVAEQEGGCGDTVQRGPSPSPALPPLRANLGGLVTGLGDGYENSSAVRALAPALARLPLAALSFNDTYLGDDGLLALCAGLLDGAVRPATLARVAAPPPLQPISRPTLSFLRTLSLSGTSVTDGAALTGPAPFLHACTALEELDLSWNRLGAQPHRFALLCASVQLHPTLRVFRAAGNLLQGGSCAVHDAYSATHRELPRHEPLEDHRRPCTCGEVAVCGEGDVVTTALSELIACGGLPGVSLREIDLRDNQLGLTPALHRRVANTTTTTTSAPLCWDEDDRLFNRHPFVNALFYNNKLERLHLDGNGFPDHVTEMVAAKLRINRRTREEILASVGITGA